MNHPLQLKTFTLLKNRPATITLQDIADGAKLPIGWLKLFHIKGDKKSSSFSRVATLYEYLTGKNLA